MSCDIELPSAGLLPWHGLRVQRTRLQWAPRVEGALVWQGKEESGPCRGGQVYRVSGPHYLDLAPVWVPDAALLCDPARRARSLWRGAWAGGIDGAV